MANDLPFREMCDKAQEMIRMGNLDVYQKFTCSHCGSRQTMEMPNVFYGSGECEECKQITNIEEKGCGMLVHARLR